jgi:hypothetical protein
MKEIFIVWALVALMSFVGFMVAGIPGCLAIWVAAGISYFVGTLLE